MQVLFSTISHYFLTKSLFPEHLCPFPGSAAGEMLYGFSKIGLKSV